MLKIRLLHGHKWLFVVMFSSCKFFWCLQSFVPAECAIFSIPEIASKGKRKQKGEMGERDKDDKQVLQ